MGTEGRKEGEETKWEEENDCGKKIKKQKDKKIEETFETFYHTLFTNFNTI